MDCTERREQVSLFIDGALGMRAQVDLFLHLAACKDCQGFLDVMLEVRERRQAETLRYPSEIDDAVLSMIHARSSVRQVSHAHREPFWRRRISMPAAFATALAIAALATLLVLALTLRHEQPLEAFLVNRQAGGSPTTVIFVYGLPEVQVVGQLTHQTKAEKILY